MNVPKHRKTPKNIKYPFKIWWKVVVPKSYRLSVLQEYDLILDETDLKIRKIPPENLL